MDDREIEIDKRLEQAADALGLVDVAERLEVFRTHAQLVRMVPELEGLPEETQLRGAQRLLAIAKNKQNRRARR